MISRLTPLALATTVFTLGTASSNAAVLFDGIGNVLSVSLAGVPNTFMGAAVNLDSAALSAGGSRISSIEAGLINTTGTSFSNTTLRLNVWIYLSYNPAAGTNPAFSNQVGSPGAPSFVFDFPNSSITTGTVGIFEGILATPLTVTPTSGTTVGFAFNWQVDQGGGFVSLTGFDVPVHANVAPPVGNNAVGASPTFGYFRNAAGEADGNFLGTSARNIGNDSGLLFAINGPDTVPEPAATALGLVFGVTLLGRRRR